MQRRARRLATLLALLMAGRLVADPLPGTKPLTIDQPLDVVMVDGIDRFALREIATAARNRRAPWLDAAANAEKLDDALMAAREQLRTIVGAVDPRLPAAGIELVATTRQEAMVATGPGYTVLQVRWPVLAGVTAEGLLLQPSEAPVARVVALPDADWSPESVSGVLPDAAVPQFARRLVEQGCQVLVPVLIDRDDTYSGHPDVRYTNQPHREFIYRQAFEMGRHIIGYEVQKVLAAVDQFQFLDQAGQPEKAGRLPVGVAGIGEGALIAMMSAALDPRIDAALVCGYFAPREGVWKEPIYRNVWAQLREFGDAELASLVAPRGLVIEAAAAPEVAGPPAVRPGRNGGAAPGAISTPGVADVKREFARASAYYARSRNPAGLKLSISSDGKGPAATEQALAMFLERLGLKGPVRPPGDKPILVREPPEAAARMKRQFDELVEFTQKLLRRSARVRDQVWANASRKSLEEWNATVEQYRNLVYDEMIGRLPEPTIHPNVRTRAVLDEPGFVGYEVLIDVYPDVVAGGILLLPKDLQPGEKRPVVVCQHGLEGVPIDTISKSVQGYNYYSAFTAELANRGFISYAPQNPYRGQDRFRTLQRKSNPLKRSLFSYIIPQHQRTIDFLKTLPNVDPERIAFYGLSYGGKTAVRVPTMLKDYCLSICSADFNEWVVKNTTVYDGYSYVFTGEYEIFEWNMGHTANYAELSYLMTPRPFMVERGHHDGVAPDEWVAWEYAKVRRHYVALGLGDKTEIEFFNGPHKINGVATYEFLHRHLKWPKRGS